MWISSVLLRIMLAMAYFTFASMLVPFLEEEYGFGDRSALSFYGLFGSDMSFFTLVCGPLYDWLGIRRSLMLCGLFSMIGFTMLGMTFDVGVTFYVSLLVFIALGIAFGLPVLDLASAKYSYPGNESQVYSLGYSTNNMGGGLGSLFLFMLTYEVTRLVKLNIVHGGTNSDTGMEELDVHNHSISASRLMILVCGVVSGLAAIVAGLTLGNVHMSKHGAVVRDGVTGADAVELVAEAEASVESAPVVVVRPRWQLRQAFSGAWGWLRDDFPALLRDPSFRRLTLFVFLSLFSRHVFQQLNTTLILYLYRVFGPHAPVNAFYAINPIGVSIMAPLCSLVTQHCDMFRCIIVGSAISSASLLIMALFDPTYLTVSLSLLLFTIGESIYSPLTTQYVMALSPEGKKGQYSALTSAPIFLGKVVVSLVSGDLLERNCSKDGSKASCGNVWSVISGVSFGTPIGLAVCYRWIHTPEVRMRLEARKTSATVEDDRAEDGDSRDDNDNDDKIASRSPRASNDIQMRPMRAQTPVYYPSGAPAVQ
jgi:MFS family permease